MMNPDIKQKIVEKLEELVELLDDAQKDEAKAEAKDHESLQKIKDWMVDSILHTKELL